jgi:hypothetical protein
MTPEGLKDYDSYNKKDNIPDQKKYLEHSVKEITHRKAALM